MLCEPALATWNTLYSLEAGQAFLHLSNNDLVLLNFSLTGKDLTLVDNQKIGKLATPPTDSTLFVFGTDLYAFSGDTDAKSDKVQNLCPTGGTLSLSKYDTGANLWDNIPLDYGNIQDATFYLGATYLSPVDTTTNDDIYIYGGICSSSGAVTSRLLSFNPKTNEFANITTSTKPQPFYGATNLFAPNPQTQLVIGGKSSNGWLNMFQLATWAFNSGWSFEQLPSTSSTVNSRKYALALPVFQPLANSSISTIMNYYSTQSVLLVGGDLSKENTPFIQKLSMDSNDWHWSDVNSNFTQDDILGAATIFNTLIVVNSTKSSDDQYVINLFDSDSLQTVQSLQKNTNNLLEKLSPSLSSTASSSLSVLQKAIVGTIVPLAALAIIAAAVVTFILKKRKRDSQQEPDDFDYQIGNYYDQSTMGSRGGLRLPTNMPNDTNSTLDAKSMDLWVRKREDFEKARQSGYLESTDTLTDAASEHTRVTDPFNDENVERRGMVPDDDEHESSTNYLLVQALPVRGRGGILPTSPQAAVLPPPGLPRMESLNQRVRKTLSFSSTIGTGNGNGNGLYGLLNKKNSTRTVRTSPSLFDDEFAYDSKSENEDDSDNASVDDRMDVQVLVSSKRRSVLRVVNPDLETIPDGEEESIHELRQRVPSGPVRDESKDVI